MSKLLKAKQWLTLEDAAKRLSISFDEDVTQKEVLQLTIEGKLALSYLLVGHAHLLVKDENALYGWRYTKKVINDKVLTVNNNGLLRNVLSQVVLGVTDLDSDQVASDIYYWWSVVDEGEEYRPIFIGREDVNDEYFADKVSNIPLKLRWLVIQTKHLIEFEQSLLDEQDKQAKPIQQKIQSQREQVLTQLIKQFSQDKLVILGRLGVWQELTKIDKSLFPPRDNANEALPKAFFRLQRLISFKSGR
jgi:hypothetical protein